MNDPTILLNWSVPFDHNKIALLDQVVNAMYGGVAQDVSIIKQIRYIHIYSILTFHY